MTQPFGLQPDDPAEVMATFGVAEAQVRRDHAISHILAALSRHHREELIFFVGTALGRTHLLDQRLSEDIDLIAVDHRDGLTDVLLKEVSSALARTHGRITWSPGWRRNSDVDPAVAVTPDGIAIQIQLLRGVGYEPWPTETRKIERRYRDAPRRGPLPVRGTRWQAEPVEHPQGTAGDPLAWRVDAPVRREHHPQPGQPLAP